MTSDQKGHRLTRFASWRRRAVADASLSFICELGPEPYAIIGRDGKDTTDRRAEALLMKECKRQFERTGMRMNVA